MLNGGARLLGLPRLPKCLDAGPARYAIALIAPLCAVALTYYSPMVRESFRTLPLFVSILLIAWTVGTGPALVATVLGAPIAEFFLIPYGGGFEPESLVRIPTLLLVGTLIVFVINGQQQKASLQATLAAIVSSSSDAIIGKTPYGTIFSWNAAAESLCGYTFEEVKGRHISMIVDPAHVAELLARLDRMNRGERVDHYETVWRHKDGHRVAVDLTVSPIVVPGGRITGASIIARNMTERERAEREARQRAIDRVRSHFQLASEIPDSLGEGVYAIDGHGRLSFLNAVGAELLGWREQDLLHKPLHARIHCQRADGSSHPPEECPVLRVLRTGQIARIDRDVFTRRDGSLLAVSYTSSPIRINDRITGAVVIFRSLGAAALAATRSA